MRFTLSALIGAALALPLAASAAPATAWVVDKGASSVRFTSALNGVGFSGVFRRWEADVHFDPANLAGSSVVATFEVASAVTGDPDRDQALPSATFLAAGAFPRATFAAHQFTALGGGRYQAIGALTVRGVTKPLTLPFSLAITGAQARMGADIRLNRLAFGVGQDEWKATTALPAVVTVSIVMAATKAR